MKWGPPGGTLSPLGHLLILLNWLKVCHENFPSVLDFPKGKNTSFTNSAKNWFSFRRNYIEGGGGRSGPKSGISHFIFLLFNSGDWCLKKILQSIYWDWFNQILVNTLTFLKPSLSYDDETASFLAKLTGNVYVGWIGAFNYGGNLANIKQYVSVDGSLLRKTFH